MWKELIIQQITGITIGAIGCAIAALVFFIVKKTKTTKDDDIVNKYIEPAFEAAYKLIPDNCAINWVKLTKNMLKAFIDEYTKQSQMPPDASDYDRFKEAAIDFAKLKSNGSVKK